MKKKRMITILLGVCGGVLLACLLLFFLFWNGVLQLNNPSPSQYPVRGVDVSSYQGEIDWDILSGQGIQFAFIKATEGSGFVDERFAYNFAKAQKTGLRVGAYHFFSYDSPGDTQAENFIQTVGKADGMLPPVIDIEFYGGNEANPPDKKDTGKQLDLLIQSLEAYYGTKPILYATEKSYQLYLAGAYSGCDIWIRNVITSPSLSDGREWTFWQFTNRMRLEGYTGEETYIDVNVFNGNQSDFNSYAK